MGMDTTFAVGEFVYIVPEWCDRPEEATRPFAVVEDWDSRLLITDMDRFWDDRAFRPTTIVEKTMVRRG